MEKASAMAFITQEMCTVDMQLCLAQKKCKQRSKCIIVVSLLEFVVFCDQLWKIRPLTIFYENRLLGSTQNLLQNSAVKEPGFKKASKPSYGQKIIHGSPVPRFANFRETEC